MKEPILITGGAGFIGSHLLRKLVETGYKPLILLKLNTDTWRIKDLLNKVTVHYIDLDYLTNYREFEDIKPKTIFHLASVGAKPGETEDSSVLRSPLMLENLINACGNFDILINTGTSSEYGYISMPMSEDFKLHPNSLYAVSKASQTLLAEHYSRDMGLPITTLRLFSVYGKDEDPNRLIPYLFKYCKANRDIYLSCPEYAHDFIHVSDVVHAYINAVELGIKDRTINVGTGTQTTLQEIADQVIKLTNFKSEVHWGSPGRSFDTKFWVADTEKMRMLKINPLLLTEGLKLCY